ncbi:MAG: acetate CoA-transferase subunit alpha [Proteocatella sp.]
MKQKVVEISQVMDLVKDGMTIMVGGFLACGTPEKLIDAIVEKGVKDITLICNDTGFVDRGVGKWVVNKQVKHTIASHVGTNKETGNQMNSGEMKVTLVPQGTLAEQVRAGGAGLGGVLTPTGLGTIVEEGKQKITVDGKEYLLETAIRADLALLFGNIVDKKGNIVYEKSTRNFNLLMAMAADTVIVEAEKIVEVGEIDPNMVMTPGVCVNYIVQG